MSGSQKVKEYHDKHAKDLRPLKEGQSVRLRDGKTWHLKGKVMERAEHPRSYAVKTEKGTIIRRNRRDLLDTPERFDLCDATEEEIEVPPSTETQPPQSKQACAQDNNEQFTRTRSGRVVKPPAYLRDFIRS